LKPEPKAKVVIVTHWKKSNPMLEGTRLINWMENISRSQFLTKAKGMVMDIKNKFNKISHKLTWDSNKVRIRMDLMAQPLSLGSHKILDIGTRNLAINITDLQNFLDYENKRIWALILEDNMRRAWDEE
jgi:hypothetical protein